MNTANLQLEGLCAAVAAIVAALRQKGMLSETEINAALDEAERKISDDSERLERLSPANAEAVLFPLRFLKLDNHFASQGRQMSFTELATLVGRNKQP